VRFHHLANLLYNQTNSYDTTTKVLTKNDRVKCPFKFIKMKRKISKKAIIILITLLVIYWTPFLVIVLSGRPNIIASLDNLPVSDAVLIFGAHITENNKVTPLLKERLDAGKAILETGKSKKIVVSNTENAAKVMAKYLKDQGILPELIEIDIQADKTLDTCMYEKNQYGEERKVIFVSQRYHLPRIIYQCKNAGIKGVAFPAELSGTIDRSQYSLLTKIQTRTSRYFREAGLTWSAFLNIYK